MNFDFTKFQQRIDMHNIQKKEIDPIDRTGQMTVISHIWNHQGIDMVDFNSFSLEDTLFALNAMENIPLYSNGDSDESFFCDPMNPYMIFRLMDNVVFELAVSKEKSYEIVEDEEIFI